MDDEYIDRQNLRYIIQKNVERDYKLKKKQKFENQDLQEKLALGQKLQNFQ